VRDIVQRTASQLALGGYPAVRTTSRRWLQCRVPFSVDQAAASEIFRNVPGAQ
jgi:hypothetical protein